jgi:hypothetical protein
MLRTLLQAEGLRRLKPGWSLPFLMLLLLAACRQEGTPFDWRQPLLVPTVVIELGAEAAGAELPLTWTPAPNAVDEPVTGPYPTFTPRPTQTAAVFPSRTPRPSATFTPSATPEATATSPPTASPTPPPPATAAPNLLPNASFEEGWYHIGNIPELQVASQWALEWDEGPNDLDPDPWNAWVRPEARVLGTNQLPAGEHSLFIWDGEQTVKIFKGRGAISFRFFTDVNLEPGTYIFTTYIFPDLVDGYTSNGTKIWAPDPLSGEVRFIIGNTTTGWVLPTFGRRNTLTHVFTVDAAQTMRIGLAVRGRWAIENNGWFMDNWSLVRAADPLTAAPVE